MLNQHEFKHDGLTYRCVRLMTPPPVGPHKDDVPRKAYWDVARSDGAGREVWVPVGEEFDATGLEAATLLEFSPSDS